MLPISIVILISPPEAILAAGIYSHFAIVALYCIGFRVSRLITGGEA